jgi:thiamine-phosphate pyrophosphorylase
MRIVIISPPSPDPRERPALEGLFAAGLERYHVRKPGWTPAELEAWLLALPAAWRPRLVLHEHPHLVAALGLGGRHAKDAGRPDGGPPAASRACHGLSSLRRLLDFPGSVLFGPVFPSFSKAGYGPAPDFPWPELASLLRGARPRAARILAIGGITAERLPRCRQLGFDGAAVLGAVWGAPDPVAAFSRIRDAAAKLEGARHAA